MLTEQALYRLMTWLSPSFPVGGYSYSHGIEFAVEDGLVCDRDSLARWVEAIIVFGAGRNDAVLFGAAWQAVTDDDPDTLASAAEMADAFRATPEMALESTGQGQAFLDTLAAVWPDPRFGKWTAALARMDRPPAYAVAVGAAAAVAGVPLNHALVAYLHAMAANLISAGVRLVPLGQTDGQRAQAALEAPVRAAAGQALRRTLDDLGGAAPVVDWTSMQHETQYTRLFRS
jgi:urease accessory protein